MKHLSVVSKQSCDFCELINDIYAVLIEHGCLPADIKDLDGHLKG